MPDLVAPLVANVRSGRPSSASCANTVPVGACRQLSISPLPRSTRHAWNTPLALLVTTACRRSARASWRSPSNGARNRCFQGRSAMCPGRTAPSCRRLRRAPSRAATRTGLAAGRSDVGIDRVLRVRHQADDVAGVVADARDVVRRAVRVRARRDNSRRARSTGTRRARRPPPARAARASPPTDPRRASRGSAMSLARREAARDAASARSPRAATRPRRRTGATRCGSARRAAAPPRRGPGSRCRCRGPARRARRTPRTSSMIGANARRSRRTGGSRRS